MPATKVEICNRNKKDILWRYIHVKWRQYWVSCSNPLAYLAPTILKLFGFCNLLSVRDEGYSRNSSYVLISISTFYYGRHVDLLRHMILGQAVFVITPDTWSWVRQSLSLLLTHDPGSGSLCHYSLMLCIYLRSTKHQYHSLWFIPMADWIFNLPHKY